MRLELINPVLGGTIQTVFEEKTPEKAAHTFWKNLTEKDKLIANEVIQFPFTLKCEDKMYHFSVSERVDDDKNVSYTITDITDEINKKSNPKEMDKFLQEAEKVKRELSGVKGGGDKKKRYKDSSSSSSSSDSDDDVNEYLNKVRIRNYKSPLNYWWYSPLIYRMPKIFTPVFVPKVTPFYQIWLPV